MTIEKQKEVADYFLNKLQEKDHHCMIAGGAPRDWYIGRVAKDIDVFVDTDFTHTELEGIIGLQVTDLTLPPEYEGNPNINSVFETRYFGQTVQIITVKTLDNLIEDFPVNISQAYYDVGQIFFTADFAEGHETKTIWTTGEDYQQGRYLARIVEKFQPLGYTLKV